MIKVVYISEASDDVVNWGGNDDPRKEGLIVGHEYELSKIIVHSYHTKIFLKDFPGKKFNSANFRPAVDSEIDFAIERAKAFGAFEYRKGLRE